MKTNQYLWNCPECGILQPGDECIRCGTPAPAISEAELLMLSLGHAGELYCDKKDIDSAERYAEAWEQLKTYISALTTRAEKAERELTERDTYIERLIEAGNTLVSEAFEYEGSVSPKNIISLRDLIAEWRKEREG
jgi:hypothetical protein